MTRETIYRELGIDADVFAFGKKVEAELKDRFRTIDETAEYNQLKVISAMHACRVSEACLTGTTGYGYNDLGRDTLEQVFAKTFHTEAALVRPLIACGTHALAIALFGNLRPGDELLSVSGKPYDTLEEVIGIRPSRGSLAEYGVTYSQVELLPDGSFDLPAIKSAITDRTKLVAIQRSKGYETRKTLSVEQIGEAVACVKSVRPDIICMVDNCYGEFVERIEPGDVGADMARADRRIYRRNEGMRGKCFLPPDLSGPGQRSRPLADPESLLLPGLFPGAGGHGVRAERRRLCRQHI